MHKVLGTIPCRAVNTATVVLWLLACSLLVLFSLARHVHVLMCLCQHVSHGCADRASVNARLTVWLVVHDATEQTHQWWHPSLLPSVWPG